MVTKLDLMSTFIKPFSGTVTNSFYHAFFETSNKIAPTILRIILGIVLLTHGCQKLLGWFGGYGFEGTMTFFTDTVGLPWILGLSVIVIEFFGSILLIVGFATRFWSISIAILMIGVALTSHNQNGFFINWLGNQKGEGVEYFLLAVAMAISIAVTGAGKFSIDRLITKRINSPHAGDKIAFQL